MDLKNLMSTWSYYELDQKDEDILLQPSSDFEQYYVQQQQKNETMIRLYPLIYNNPK